MTQDTQVNEGWGEGPSARYEQLAAPFRPLFARIRAGAVEREIRRTLPHEPIRALARAGFTALRVPQAAGGAGASLPELFNLLTELGTADSNVVQALRAHLGFVETVLNAAPGPWREAWFARIVQGQLVGPGRGETGEVEQGKLATRLSQREGRWLLNGTKFYSTGVLFSDWIDVGAVADDGTPWAATVPRDAPGVEPLDDWNGFGQRLTSSGTTRYRDVVVDPTQIRRDEQRFPYAQAFYQLVHLATAAGIGRAVSQEAATAVRERERSFSHGNAARVRDDPQVLEVVGELRASAYCAGAIVLQTARALERAWQAAQAGDAQRMADARANADLEIAQAQSTVFELVLQSSSRLFDALGASSTLAPHALDRFWRNVRTLATHNPRIYKSRIAGDFAVNHRPAPDQWKIGVLATARSAVP
ncbi:MAG TPA: acyl-CoA dehydrogenase family protein [Pseudorhodoferax sp.]|nr:acyl-CoA dehydrogenase family protein [Pseudorhodoferax sp.]